MDDAYTMCNGQADALPNTHNTITATLILQSSRPSVVLIAPSLKTTTTTTTTTTSSAYKVPTSSLAAITTPETTVLSTLSIQTATGSSTKASATTISSAAEAASKTTSPVSTLTKSQIVGITVASIGGGVLAVGILVLFTCWRRRKRSRDSDILPFQMDPFHSHGSKGPTEMAKNCKGPGGTAHGVVAKLAPPVPPRIDTGYPRLFARRSIRPDTIGLAISPERNEAVSWRHSSKLLPEKPTLTLKVPEVKAGSGLKFSQSVQQHSAISRQSTATQFEEDDLDSADTAVAGPEDWGRGSLEQILNNRTGDWRTLHPVPPELRDPSQLIVSSSTWTPANQSSTKDASSLAPPFEVKPLKFGGRTGSFSRPLVVRNDPFSRPPASAQLEIPAQTTSLITRSSSLYSTPHDSLPPINTGRNSTATRRKSCKESGTYDRQVSAGSPTSFETVDSLTSPRDQGPKTARADLSPVVESPASGKSPVSYPKIPGRLSRDYIRMVEPPPQPDFEAVFSSQGEMRPWRIAEINAQRERHRIIAQAQRENQSQSQQLGSGPQGMHGQPHQRPQRDYIAPSAAYNSVNSKIQFPAPDPSYHNQTTHPFLAPSGPTIPNPSSSRSSSMISQHSNASSLLAKRRGEQKAQALKLINEDDKKTQQAKWRVLKEKDIERAKSPGWRPQLAGRGAMQVVEQLPSTLDGSPN